MRTKNWAAVAGGLVLLGVIGRDAARAQDPAVQAAPIPPEAAVKEAAVKPLTVRYYNFGRVRPPGMSGIDSMEIALNFIRERSPDATVPVPSGVVNCPASGEQRTIMPAGKSLGDLVLGFLEMEKMRIAADNGSGPPVPPELGIVMSTRNIFVFDGFIRVEKAGVYAFRIPCDDAAQLTIGGVVVHTTPEGGMPVDLSEQHVCKAEFSEPGIYPVNIVHYDKAMHAGIKVFSDVVPLGPSGGPNLHLLQFLGNAPAVSQSPAPAAAKGPDAAAKDAGVQGGSAVRTWTSGQGRKIEASLVRRDENTVILEKTDGTQVTVQFQRLSKGDQDFLKTLDK